LKKQKRADPLGRLAFFTSSDFSVNWTQLRRRKIKITKTPVWRPATTTAAAKTCPPQRAALH